MQKGLGADGGVVQKGSGADGRGGELVQKGSGAGGGPDGGGGGGCKGQPEFLTRSGTFRYGNL